MFLFQGNFIYSLVPAPTSTYQIACHFKTRHRLYDFNCHMGWVSDVEDRILIRTASIWMPEMALI